MLHGAAVSWWYVYVPAALPDGGVCNRSAEEPDRYGEVKKHSAKTYLLFNMTKSTENHSNRWNILIP